MRHQEIAGLGVNFRCKSSRSFADQELVRELFKKLACDANRVQKAFESANSTRSESCAVHHGGVQFNFSEQIRPTSSAYCPHILVGFDDADPSFDGIKADGTLREKPRGYPDP
jgi:hypothetical protein